ncbi:hypothetical protein [Aureispira sp. CCB-QB1]|uniref:hypothetical protein n=1 Tax=Aureispira sp. CCB-QB1 TaxID=1313421 RepID=UPI00069609DC|nr:hypothetical protein [Aureispira sp. CCB-QB1]
MKQRMNFLLALIIGLGIITSASAQKKKPANFDEGIIKYKIEVEGMPEAAQFANSSLINLYLKGKDSKMDISIMGGMASFQLINNMTENLFTLLMDVPTFYEKTAVSIDEDSDFLKELKEAGGRNQAPTKDVEVKYFKNKKQKIAKYPCYKAELEMGDGSSDKLIVYLTEKLRPTALSQVEKTLGVMQGFPLGFEMRVEGMLIKITAIDVIKENLDEDAFIVPESYSKKTMDEFKEEIEHKMGTGNGGIGL